MDRENGVASVDAAEVGLALAFPGGMRSYIEAVAAEGAPVERAVAAAWARMDSLRVVTADLNGSIARPRVAGLSRARHVLQSKAEEPAWQSADSSRGTENEPGEVQQIAPVSEASAPAAVRAASELGDVGGAAPEERVGPLTAGDGKRHSASNPEGWPSDMGQDDVAVAPAGAEADSDATDEASGSSRRSIAPVSIRVVREAANGSGLGYDRRDALPNDEMGGVSTAIAPLDAGGGSHGAGMRADVASALRSREMSQSNGDSETSSSVPGWQDQRQAAADGTLTTKSAVHDTGGAAPSGGENGAAMAPTPAGRDGGGAGDVVLGNIMLDGHAVGTWMASRMARDAGRPGAGTTSFDPRQAPAWTPSGAL